jgi:hypothetical protein
VRGCAQMKTRFRFEKLEVWQETRTINRSLFVPTSKTPFRRTKPPALDPRRSTLD